MKISDFKIRTRLSFNWAAAIGFNLLITGIGVFNLSDVTKSTEIMVEANEKQSLAQEWSKIISNNAVRTFARAKNNDPMLEEHLKKEMESQSELATKVQEKLEGLILQEKGKQLLVDIAAKRKEYTDIRKEVFNLKAEKGQEGKEDVTKVIETRLVPAMNSYVNSLQELVKFEQEVFIESHHSVLEIEKSSRNIMLIGGLLAAIIGSFLTWLLSRSITKPLNYAVEVAQTVASGDLTHKIKIDSKDETGILLKALKDMNVSLSKIVNEVRTGTDLISTASSQIAAGNMDLSSRTEQQAAALEETASSMEELTSTVQQNADNAKQATQLANSASFISEKGGEVVTKVVSTMKDIDESSKKIVEIISVIDSIAFQTNILSLNAAVEAARAGEQGKGFGVVASEVRNLAQRSASAAKEIKNLINDTVDKTHNGAMLVEQAGTTMSQVVESVRKVADIMDEISSASQEQASGIEQVNKAITQMDEVTQQNAALVEEASAASYSMQDEASKLAQTVSVFKI